jgi:SAM-dependent methyltransferase
MSKRDEDASDMEVGMTTAERRRRRRRGGGLRVPSDNVPRARTPTGAPPPPVPEDPALAMSIAYSFTSDASGPVPRAGTDPSAPIAPDAMPTVIDPPSAPVESQDFEMNTREMSAVDLEALGLASDSATMPFQRISSPHLERGDGGVTHEPASKPAPAPRHATVALAEDDIEVIRAATERAQSQSKATTEAEAAVAPRSGDANKTMQLQAIDVEVLTKSPASEEPMSVPDIDIHELADRAESSGEIEVDVDAEEPVLSGSPAPPMRAQTTPPAPPERSSAENQPTPKKAEAPRPPPPAAKPPAPPPPAVKKSIPQAAVAAVVGKEPSRPNKGKQQRQWFVDLFDEDYLRTLPFLTPQATQSEAEFAIHAMNLAPGAQVLDLGCGYGRHAMELAARGFHVVGLDLSTPLLVRGGEEAHRRGLTINFVRGDMRELDFEAQFDGCYCLFSTFGYFDDETNKKTLQNVARALKPGGKILLEILNRDYVIADLPTRVWWEGDGCVVLEEVELNYFSSRIQVNRSVVFDDGRQLEQEISVRAYSLHEVGKLMHAAGFRVLEVSGGYQMRGRFLGNQSRHIIVLAERKESSGS